LAYVGYQWWSFGAPWAFVQTQAFWRVRPPVDFWERAIDLACLEPVSSVFDSSSPCYWAQTWEGGNPIFNGRIVNVGIFLLSCVVVLAGTWGKKLTAKEAGLAGALLLIPYATRAHEMCMASASRFAAVIFPVPLVVGNLLTRSPVGVIQGILGITAFLLGVYAALFAAGYGFF